MTVVAPPGASWPDLDIRVQPNAGESLVLLGLTGLEPVAANVNTQDYAAQDGAYHSGSQVGKRNIVATVGLILGDDSRHLLYAYLPPKNAIKLRFSFTNRDPVYIDGIVENNLPAGRFTESPDIPTMQVSIICAKPNFLSATKYVTGWTKDPQGNDNGPTNVPYSGTTGGGFELTLAVGDNNFDSPLKLISQLGNETRTMSFKNLNIVAGWDIFISTHPGRKIAEFRPPQALIDADGAEPISFLGKMWDLYFWTKFFAGTQQFRVLTTGTGNSRQWTLAYSDQFAGI